MIREEEKEEEEEEKQTLGTFADTTLGHGREEQLRTFGEQVKEEDEGEGSADSS